MQPLFTSVDVAIIGGGIAGLSAALYTARNGLKTLIITIDLGGQLTYAEYIENYPGIDSIKGLDLVMRIQRQVQRFGTEILFDEVIELVKHDKKFYVKTRSGKVIEAIAVIAACGKAPKRLGIEGEDMFLGKGLSYCVVCDGPLYRGKKVALVSLGTKGMEVLSFLSPIAGEVHYIVPHEDDPSIAYAARINNVKVYPGYRVVALKGDEQALRSIEIVKNNTKLQLDIDALFVELGFETRIDFLRPYVDTNERGEVIVDKLCRTKTEGLFAAGDLVDTPYKQAVIAAASGVIAALSAINYINEIKGLRKILRSDWSKQKQRRRSFRL